jgi:hypothetical protein
MKRLSLLVPLSAFAGVCIAEEPAQTAPPPPPSLSDEEQIEPEVNIIQREDKIIEEYRVNGRLYMIKVTPKNAPPYYLIDSNGDGSMDARRTELEPELMIPRWVIFRW